MFNSAASKGGQPANKFRTQIAIPYIRKIFGNFRKFGIVYLRFGDPIKIKLNNIKKALAYLRFADLKEPTFGLVSQEFTISLI